MAGTAAFKSFFKSHSSSSPRLWLIRDARPFESAKFPVSIALMVLVEPPTNLEIARFAAERRFAKEQTRAADLIAHQSSSKKLAGERANQNQRLTRDMGHLCIRWFRSRRVICAATASHIRSNSSSHSCEVCSSAQEIVSSSASVIAMRRAGSFNRPYRASSALMLNSFSMSFKISSPT